MKEEEKKVQHTAYTLIKTQFSCNPCKLLLYMSATINLTPQVACGSGLALIYEFLLTDEEGNRPGLQAVQPKVHMAVCVPHFCGCVAQSFSHFNTFK